MDDGGGGGSVVVAEALRQRAAQQRARWEAFQKKRRSFQKKEEDEEEREDSRRRWQHPDSDGGSAINAAPSTFNNELDAASGRVAAANRAATTAGPSQRVEDAGGVSEAGAASVRGVINDHGVEHDGNAPHMCRICFAGEEAGRLFAPCRCRGSIGKVHVSCLNAWRNMSANQRSYFQCDQCGYRYNVERAQWASKLENPDLAVALSAMLIVLVVVVAGVASRLFSARVLAAGKDDPIVHLACTLLNHEASS